MRQTKRKMVPMYSAEDFFFGKNDAKPVGLISDSDDFSPVILDRETLFRLKGESGKADEKKKGEIRWALSTT